MMQIPMIDPNILRDVKQKTASNLVHSTRIADPSRKISLDELGYNPMIEQRLRQKIRRNADKLERYKLKVMLYKFEDGKIQVHITDVESEQILSVFEGKKLEELLESLDTLVGLLLDITL